jgi:carbon starvation protein
MGTMPDGTQGDSTHRTTQDVSTHGTVQLDDGIVPDPSLPPTSVDESVRDAADRTWTPAKIALWAAIALLGGVAWFMLAIIRRDRQRHLVRVRVSLHVPDRLPLLLQGH